MKDQMPSAGCEKCGVIAKLPQHLLIQLLKRELDAWLCNNGEEISKRDNAEPVQHSGLRLIRPLITDIGRPQISIDDLNIIKLDLKVIDNGLTAFRMSRIIREPEAADKAVNDLGVKLAATRPWTRRGRDVPEDYGNEGICLKVRIQSGIDVFLIKCAEYLVCREECISFMNALRVKLGNLLVQKEFIEENISIGKHYPSLCSGN